MRIKPSDSTRPPCQSELLTFMPPPPVPQSVPPRMQRHKSVSRRMLSKVKQGISNRSKATSAIRPIESETSLLRRLSGRRKQSADLERRAQSFEVSRNSVDSTAEEYLHDALTITYPPRGRSLTDSTVSINETVGVSPTLRALTPGSVTPDMMTLASSASPKTSSPPPEQTPRPPNKSRPSALEDEQNAIEIVIPHIELAVMTDRTAVDAGTAQDIWIAIEATVRSRAARMTVCGVMGGRAFDAHVPRPSGQQSGDFGMSTPASTQILGSIISLRLCFKPADRCRVLDIVGQKALRDLQPGQTCSLFIRARVSGIKPQADVNSEPDNASIFAELESIVGTLETDLLHVEARYRHSLLPTSNVITVRHTARIRRPRIESRWSMLSPAEDLAASDEVHTKLAIHLADHYSLGKALKLIDSCLRDEIGRSEAVRQIRQIVVDDIKRPRAVDLGANEGPTQSADNPSLVVTDIERVNTSSASRAASEQFSTAPGTPLSEPQSRVSSNTSTTTSALRLPPAHIRARTTSLSAITALSPHSPTAIPNNFASSTTNLPATDLTSNDQDAARELWRHIRRSSLSAKQIIELAAQPVQQLAASDEVLTELRQQALANKRSIGAETLRSWKWDGKMGGRGEAPWL